MRRFGRFLGMTIAAHSAATASVAVGVAASGFSGAGAEAISDGLSSDHGIETVLIVEAAAADLDAA